jgi:hypothetical protein
MRDNPRKKKKKKKKKKKVYYNKMVSHIKVIKKHMILFLGIVPFFLFYFKDKTPFFKRRAFLMYINGWINTWAYKKSLDSYCSWVTPLENTKRIDLYF